MVGDDPHKSTQHKPEEGTFNRDRLIEGMVSITYGSNKENGMQITENFARHAKDCIGNLGYSKEKSR